MQKHLNHPIFDLVRQEAGKLNQSTFVIGGFVRDSVMGKTCKDIDFVTLGDGLTLARNVAAQLQGDVKVNYFKNFGTAHIHYHDWDFEFVGARKESYQPESRNPQVERGNLEDDQLRRDFTINALAISLNEVDYGAFIDPFDGLKHIDEKRIKTPQAPETTFSDDPLRMLRAIRFATQLNFEIDPETLAGITVSAERIKIVSGERIADELNKIIESRVPSIGFKLLFDTGLLALIFPELAKLQGVETRNGMKHKDNFYHTLQVLDQVAEVSDHLWLRWAAILHDIAKPATKDFSEEEGWTFHGHEYLGMKMVKPIFKRLKLPLDAKMRYVQKLVQLHLRPIALTKEIVTDSAVRRLLFDAGEDLEDLLTLCRCDITSKNEFKVRKFLKNLDEVEQKIQDVEERDRIRNFQPEVSGEEIMEMFDLKPSREVGLIKNALKDAVLDGAIKNNREEAINFVASKGEAMGLRLVKKV